MTTAVDKVAADAAAPREKVLAVAGPADVRTLAGVVVVGVSRKA
jgi:hypothetical protein